MLQNGVLKHFPEVAGDVCFSWEKSDPYLIILLTDTLIHVASKVYND